MWGSASFLNTVSTIGLWAAAVFGGFSLISALIGGLAASRASDLTRQDAEVRIANANARAEAAHLETARIRERIAWRRISGEQRTALVRALQGEHFAVWTSWVGNDPEATLFRNELDAALKESGLETKHFSGWERAAGLSILGNNSPEKAKLVRAFQAAGLDFIAGPPGEFSPNDLVIVVGTKPDPA